MNSPWVDFSPAENEGQRGLGQGNGRKNRGLRTKKIMTGNKGERKENGKRKTSGRGFQNLETSVQRIRRGG